MRAIKVDKSQLMELIKDIDRQIKGLSNQVQLEINVKPMEIDDDWDEIKAERSAEMKGV